MSARAVVVYKRCVKGFVNVSGSKNFHTCGGRKRGPRDGWYGMRLKVLRFIAVSGGASVRELSEYFGISRRAVYYHLYWLMDAGLVRRVCGRLHDPGTVYVVAGDFLVEGGLSSTNGGALPTSVFGVYVVLLRVRVLGRGLGAKEVACRVGVGVRRVRQLLGRLRELGLVAYLGGCRCPYGVWFALYPWERNVLPVHRHRYVRFHRY